MFRKCVYLMVGIFLSLSVPAQAQNWLTNGDFNTGDFTGWWTYAGGDPCQTVEIEPGSGYNIDGTDNAKLWSAIDWPQVEIGQALDVTGGTNFTLSFDYSARWTDWGTADWLISYSDTDWTEFDWAWGALYEDGPAPNLDGEWLSFSQSFTAPAGTEHMTIALRAYDWTTVHFDNVTVVPEPATLLLLGLGGFVLRRRKT
ncbi:MAG: PEP-CTERM sorting domain-containing protein [Sedimentisphaerales bacterium]|nr:PEP-CTERM sorting domain-containing protein [Sedimentisphaerales bacterium]